MFLGNLLEPRPRGAYGRVLGVVARCHRYIALSVIASCGVAAEGRALLPRPPYQIFLDFKTKPRVPVDRFLK